MSYAPALILCDVCHMWTHHNESMLEHLLGWLRLLPRYIERFMGYKGGAFCRLLKTYKGMFREEPKVLKGIQMICVGTRLGKHKDMDIKRLLACKKLAAQNNLSGHTLHLLSTIFSYFFLWERLSLLCICLWNGVWTPVIGVGPQVRGCIGLGASNWAGETKLSETQAPVLVWDFSQGPMCPQLPWSYPWCRNVCDHQQNFSQTSQQAGDFRSGGKRYLHEWDSRRKWDFPRLWKSRGVPAVYRETIGSGVSKGKTCWCACLQGWESGELVCRVPGEYHPVLGVWVWSCVYWERWSAAAAREGL